MPTDGPARSATQHRHLELVRECGSGQISDEHDAELHARFERDVIPLLPRLHHQAFRVTRHHADAEDLVQDTLVKAYTKFGSFRHDTNLLGWLLRILINTHINSYRKKIRRPMNLPAEVITDWQLAAAAAHTSTGMPSAEDRALDLLPNAQIEAAIRQLHRPFGLTVYYADIQGYPYRQIAQIMNCSVGVVKSRLHRGRRQLRALIGDIADRRYSTVAS